MSLRFDLAIIGGGCAGLSLARDLVRLGGKRTLPPRTVIIEPRTEYENDRTWCFWARDAGPDQALVTASWQQWSFSSQGRNYLHSPGRGWAYHCIPAANFYHNALATIASEDWVELHKGEQVNKIKPYQNGFRLQTNRNELFAAKVVDTRPLANRDVSQSTLLQAFIGVEIEGEFSLVHTDQVGLMRDMDCDRFGFKFNYILPLSCNRFLVEVTRFCHGPAALDQLPIDLEQTLQRYSPGGRHRVIRREQGIIPMGLAAKAQPLLPNWIRVGGAGGAIRSSTGYAYRRIQSWSNQCARQLLRHDRIIQHPADARALALMDHLFLQVIRRHPDMAPDLFMALAHKVEPAALVRFLTDSPTMKDLWSVVRALPAWPFLKQLIPAVQRSPNMHAGSAQRG